MPLSLMARQMPSRTDCAPCNNSVFENRKNATAVLGEPARARFVVAKVPVHAMLIAVELDDEFGGRTIEIDDIGTDGLLPPETQACHLLATQQTPEFAFGIGCRRAKFVRAFVLQYPATRVTLRADGPLPDPPTPRLRWIDPPSRGGLLFPSRFDPRPAAVRRRPRSKSARRGFRAAIPACSRSRQCPQPSSDRSDRPAVSP
jgi:hypothetical protein